MINMVDVFVIYDTVQYTKNDWRNRNRIMTKNGPQWLTIPVRVESLHQRIEDTQVARDNWNKKHWNSIVANYSRAPCFDQYRVTIETLYQGMETKFLSEINFRFIKKICNMLNIETQIVKSSELDLSGDKNERLLQICESLDAQTYLSGPAAKTYMDLERFKANGVEVKWMEYNDYMPYRQLSTEFEHGVSILDLLFNEGQNSANYLNSFE